MILPNKTLELERTMINQIRGCGAWYYYWHRKVQDIPVVAELILRLVKK